MQNATSHVTQASDGTEIHFETHGDRSKPAIFMGPHFYVSRSPDDGSFTESWIAGLERDFFLITADYPRGVGRTGNPLGLGFNPDVAREECELIADAAGVDRFGWLGYSYGGAMGVQLACRTSRVAALAVGGFPPLNAPFRLMIDILTSVAAAPPPGRTDVDPQVVRTAVGFYMPLVDWPEREEVTKLTIPRMVFMGDQDTAQGMPAPWAVPLADNLRAVEEDLRELNWQIRWLEGHGHRTAIVPGVSLPVVHQFFSESLRP